MEQNSVYSKQELWFPCPSLLLFTGAARDLSIGWQHKHQFGVGSMGQQLAASVFSKDIPEG